MRNEKVIQSLKINSAMNPFLDINENDMESFANFLETYPKKGNPELLCHAFMAKKNGLIDDARFTEILKKAKSYDNVKQRTTSISNIIKENMLNFFKEKDLYREDELNFLNTFSPLFIKKITESNLSINEAKDLYDALAKEVMDSRSVLCLFDETLKAINKKQKHTR